MKTISVNMKQMGKWNVTQDNVRQFDAIVRNGGIVVTLDARPYIEWLCEFGIFFTCK